MISCERFLNFLLTEGALFRIMDTSLEDYSRGLRGRVGNAVGVLKRAWVRIPCLPSINKTIDILFFNTSIKKTLISQRFFL